MNPMTESILFKPGYSCNNRCVYCKAKNMSYDLDTLELKMRISNIAKMGKFKMIIFSGGEVTIRKDFFKLMHFAREAGFKVGIATNLRMISHASFFKKLNSFKPETIFASFPSSRKDIFEKITSCDSFDQAHAGLRNASSINTELIVNVVLSKLNYEHLLEIVDFLIKNKVRIITISRFQNHPGSDDLSIDTESIKSALSSIRCRVNNQDLSFLFDSFDKKIIDGLFGNAESSFKHYNLTWAFEPFENRIAFLSEEKI